MPRKRAVIQPKGVEVSLLNGAGTNEGVAHKSRETKGYRKGKRSQGTGIVTLTMRYI
ncbi:hypothetical protein KTT66_08740 [Lacticaseibacillus casei]|jgi:hypothetical protein|uniref:Uncharacterized protein n=1 Tax=Lacticaseibacillus huelsenbergensis TaxID=3035291 RepID=A0ABY8DTE3_9LACO|nr:MULTISPECIES: hypothetical protein [Lacticaseibacillus]MDG3062287.1 hypothetical protein [Lacticaseibacillus sp. BCRC 81376]QVI36489.1 hypothetical protein KGS74_09515 [Lacticaseibacillus casei]QXG58285.1 hypothetical protein KTT66_08740 [Lacticaseibacillus casei]WFB40258.1 hypothetical protein LHUE1_001038 [Lacticaseibacillus huelsenbergensis]WFB41987.1 hypothetical protein LHUE2_002859 [Lacticaseibacillus huelsenbergensis]